MRFAVSVALLALALGLDALRIRARLNSVLSQKYPGVDTVLYSVGITDWGDWGPWQVCPRGSFVTGFTLKTHSKVGPTDDNTGINGIRLFCTKRIDRDGHLEDTGTLESATQRFGSWWGGGNCTQGQAVGLRLRQLPKQYCGDDVSTSDITLYCSGKVKKITGNGIPDWGTWLSKETCPSGQSICGLSTQVEPFQGNYRPPANACFTIGDDTALNNIVVGCCQNGIN